MLDSSPQEFDYALAGGGLQNGLVALAVLEQRPDAKIALIERGTSIGGNHVWCFHAGDLPETLGTLVDRLTVKSWSGYDVMFPGYERRVDQPYAALTSARLDEVVQAAFVRSKRSELLLGAAVVRASRHEVELDSGRRVRAKVVISATGPGRPGSVRGVGFQKFLGLELELSSSNPCELPILMDARVPQLDGLRFFYVLPFARDRVLVEDTYFSADPELDTEFVRREVLAYAKRAGYAVRRIVREETGVLPLPTRNGVPIQSTTDQPFKGGYAGGFFHPTTGYSFPAAARLAELVAQTRPEALGPAWANFCAGHARQFRYLVFLNRLLFHAFAPERRYGAMERFYRLPEPTLSRFYAMRLTPGDRVRILCGKPPSGFSLRLAFSGGVT